jgi:hypothetical protein
LTQPDYQCVQIGEVWHLTQEQATLPKIFVGGAYTTCAKWASFMPREIVRRRPTCAECVHHVDVYEKKRRGKAFDWIDEVGKEDVDE